MRSLRGHSGRTSEYRCADLGQCDPDACSEDYQYSPHAVVRHNATSTRGCLPWHARSAARSSLAGHEQPVQLRVPGMMPGRLTAETVKTMTENSTVRSVTYDLLRSLGLTTVFGNPGSTEETFLQEFPGDFRYVLALQEASAIAMADAFAQVTRRPALVNLHSSAGVGNAMGNLVAAFHGNTPLIVTAGQQHRELLIGEPYLGNREATTMPKPWVKWSYEP